jgi:hypothetical protein
MLLIGAAVGFMSGVLLMFFLLEHRASEDRIADLAGTVISHTPAKAHRLRAQTFFRVPGSQA